MQSLGKSQLYTFVDAGYLQGRCPADIARQLCDGGSDLIQLRAKNESIESIRRMALAILPVTRAAGIPLVINDCPQVAVDLGAEFIHLGQEDFFDRGFTHRSQNPALGHSLKLGLSSHAPEQARRAIEAGADYIAIGPIFVTRTKPGRLPVTLDYVNWASTNVQIPWFAIGGITLQNIDEVMAAGAKRICVVSAVLNAPDISAACRAFKSRLQ